MRPRKDHYEKKRGNFYLDKWFLDFTGENGDAMIFYAAKLRWHGWIVSYTSWLQHDASHGVRTKSRFHHVQMPQKKDDIISWSDLKFGITGTWKSVENEIQTRIYNSKEGFLDWKCFQPASKVQLKIRDKVLEGSGYVEQLTLSIVPWNIPMNELRWGHFGSDEKNIVWIELIEKEKKQWLWLNGDKMENVIIKDEYISIPHKDITLKLDRGTILEAEKKILSVAGKIVKYIPGFKNVMPIHFLMADEFKWLSKGEFQEQNKICSRGLAIHEWVNFRDLKP